MNFKLSFKDSTGAYRKVKYKVPHDKLNMCLKKITDNLLDKPLEIGGYLSVKIERVD